jgi:hypothetical protein
VYAIYCMNASKGADPATEKQAGRKAQTIGDLADLYIEMGEAAQALLEGRRQSAPQESAAAVAASGARGHHTPGRASAC